MTDHQHNQGPASGLLPVTPTFTSTFTPAPPSGYRRNWICSPHTPVTKAQGESMLTGWLPSSPLSSSLRTSTPLSAGHQKHSDICEHH